MTGFEKDETRLDARHALQSSIDLREFLQEPTFAHVGDDSDAFESGVAAADELRERGNQLAGQVVDAEISEVFERPDGVRLPGTREPGHDHEPVVRVHAGARW